MNLSYNSFVVASPHIRVCFTRNLFFRLVWDWHKRIATEVARKLAQFNRVFIALLLSLSKWKFWMKVQDLKCKHNSTLLTWNCVKVDHNGKCDVLVFQIMLKSLIRIIKLRSSSEFMHTWQKKKRQPSAISNCRYAFGTHKHPRISTYLENIC